MRDIAVLSRQIVDVDTVGMQPADKIDERIDGAAGPGADMKHVSVSVEDGGQVRFNHVFDIDEIPGLLAIAVNMKRGALTQAIAEYRHDTAFSLGGLTRTIDVPIAKNGVLQAEEAVI